MQPLEVFKQLENQDLATFLSQEGADAGIFAVSAADAKTLLMLNTENVRPVSKRSVTAYEKLQAQGSFAIAPDALMFGIGGYLGNGQHRLTAQTKSGVACRYIIQRGATEADIRAADQGAKRNSFVTHQLPKNETAIINALWYVCHNGDSKHVLSRDEQVVLVGAFRDELRKVATLKEITGGSYMQAPFFAALLARETPPSRVYEAIATILTHHRTSGAEPAQGRLGVCMSYIQKEGPQFHSSQRFNRTSHLLNLLTTHFRGTTRCPAYGADHPWLVSSKQRIQDVLAQGQQRAL